MLYIIHIQYQYTILCYYNNYYYYFNYFANKFLTLFLLINYSLRVVVKFAIVTAFFHDMNSDVVVSRPPTTSTTETTSSIKIWLTRFTIACFFLSGGIEYSEWYDEISFHCLVVLVTDQLCLSRCHSPDMLGLYA